MFYGKNTIKQVTIQHELLEVFQYHGESVYEFIIRTYMEDLHNHFYIDMTPLREIAINIYSDLLDTSVLFKMGSNGENELSSCIKYQKELLDYNNHINTLNCGMETNKEQEYMIKLLSKELIKNI